MFLIYFGFWILGIFYFSIFEIKTYFKFLETKSTNLSYHETMHAILAIQIELEIQLQ